MGAGKSKQVKNQADKPESKSDQDDIESRKSAIS